MNALEVTLTAAAAALAGIAVGVAIGRSTASGHSFRAGLRLGRRSVQQRQNLRPRPILNPNWPGDNTASGGRF